MYSMYTVALYCIYLYTAQYIKRICFACLCLTISPCITIYTLWECLCKSLYLCLLAMCPCVCLCVRMLVIISRAQHLTREMGGVNILPLKMISLILLLPLISIHLWCGRERIERRRGRKFESLHPSVKISFSPFMPPYGFIYSSHHSCAPRCPVFLTSGPLQYITQIIKRYVSSLLRNKQVNCKALPNVINIFSCKDADIYSTSPSSLSTVFLWQHSSMSFCRAVNWFDISCLWPKEKLSLDEPTNRWWNVVFVGVCRCVWLPAWEVTSFPHDILF